MKRYYNNDNLELDPSRFLYNNNNNNNNNLLSGFNKPISKLQDDIIINNLSIRKAQPKKDLFNHEDISLEFLPKNNNNQLVPITDRNSITHYNNDKFRFKNMSQELMDKDEEIQKYKNEVYQLQNELGESRKEKSKMISYDMENKMLKDKLNEHYSLSRELTEVKHNFKREQIDNKSNYKTIELLKKIVHKQHVRLATKDYEDSDEEESEDESDISDSDETDYSSEEEEDIVLKKGKKKKTVPKNIYYNTMLKNSLVKQRLPAKKIDKLMIQMKITPKTKITKKLLIDFLNNMKK